MQNREYFHYLDSLRFLAFLAVFIAHASILFPVSRDWFYALFRAVLNHGGYGVNFFFILSGFLITYLLLKEKRSTGTINIKFFYLKRVLRIWPLYFVVFITSVFILPWFITMLGAQYVPGSSDTFVQLRNTVDSPIPLWFLLFSGNFFMAYDLGTVPFALSVLWSVCVEEQFYLVWPWFVKWLKGKTLFIASITVFLISFIYKTIHLNDANLAYYSTVSVAMDLATGCAFGIIFFRYQKDLVSLWVMHTARYARLGFFGTLASVGRYITKTVSNVIVRLSKPQIVFLITIFAAFIFGIAAIVIRSVDFYVGDIFGMFYDFARLMKRPVLDIFFLSIIAFFVIRSRVMDLKPIDTSIAIHPRKILIKDRLYHALTYAGKISYGLYGYHAIVLLAVLAIFNHFGVGPNSVTAPIFLLIFSASLLLTYLLSHFSYIFLEERFINLRRKFNKDAAGKNIKTKNG